MTLINFEKTVFISYRRTNEYTALAVYQDLTANGYDVFIDYLNIDSGNFESVILENIKGRAHFVIILTPSALERCDDPNDWLRREIECAIDTKRNIVPLMMEGFDYSDPSIDKHLTGKLSGLKGKNAVKVPPTYFFEAMTRLRERFLTLTNNVQQHTVSDIAQQEAENQQKIANETEPVSEETLTAVEYFERAYQHAENGQLDEAIADYTEAIRLKLDYAIAYNNRGIAYRRTGKYKHAVADYTEAIRLKPNDAIAYNNRGNAYNAKGENERAITDYTEAIRLKPDDADAYYNRGIAYRRAGENERAIIDYTEAIRLKPDYTNAYYNRGVAYYHQGENERTIADYTEAIRLNSDFADAYNNRGEVYFATGDFASALADFKKANELQSAFNFGIAGQAITHHALGEEQIALNLWKMLCGLDERYNDPDWTGKELDWRPELVEEARKLIAKL